MAAQRQGHRCVALPDEDGRICCYLCGRVQDEGRAGVSLSSRYLSHGTVHKVVELEPVEDDEVAS